MHYSRNNGNNQQKAQQFILMIVDLVYFQTQLQLIIKGYLKIMSQTSLMITDQINIVDNDPYNKVVLEVGFAGDTWKYYVERNNLAEKSEWFRILLTGSMAPPASNPPPIIRLQHVDKRAFDHLFKYFSGESVCFHSVITARLTLDAAHYYLCPELAKIAVDYIIKNLTPSTVLTVYHGLHLYIMNQNSICRDNSKVLALPGDDATEIAMSCSQLFNACLTVIDQSPDQVLRQESFEELTIEEVKHLSCRDDLKLTKENVLFKALEKWAASECRRRGIEPTAYNKRTALSDEIWYSVRYLFMNDREFIQGPMASGILSSAESAAIVAKILGHTDNQENDDNSISNRVFQKLTTVPRKSKQSNKVKKCMKSGKKEREDNRKNQRKECASQSHQACTRVGEFVIRALACVFD